MKLETNIHEYARLHHLSAFTSAPVLGWLARSACALVCAWGISEVAYAQVVVSSGGGSRVAAGSPAATTVPNGPPSAYMQTPGVIFAEKLEPALVGYTFDYDSTSGSYALRRPLFSTTLSDNTGAPDEFRARFGSVLNGEKTYLSNGFYAGIDGTVGLAHVAASFATSSEASRSVLGTTFRLTAEADFPMAAADFLSLPQSAFDPTAWSILHMPGGSAQADISRTNAWFAAGFGEFVAFGYDLRGGVDVVFSMQQTEDYRAFESRFDLLASYSTVTATLNIVEKMRAALETGQFSFSIETQGCNPPHLPQLLELQSIQGQLDYADELNAHASSCKRHVGLYLISAFALPNGPAISVPTWDDAVLSVASTEVDNALRAWFAASRWNFSPRIAAFMAGQMRAYPNQSQSYDKALQICRGEIAVRLDALRTALKVYADPENVGDAGVIDVVLTSATSVHNAVVALQLVLNEIDVRIATLPAMQFTLADGMTPQPGNDNLCSAWVSVQVDNVGVFSPITNNELEALLMVGSPYTETLFFDEYFPGSAYGTHAWSNGGITSVDLLEAQPIAAGPGAGLYRLKFDMIVDHLHSSATNVRLRLVDDINRIGYAPYNLAQ